MYFCSPASRTCRSDLESNAPLLPLGLDDAGISSNGILYHHNYRGDATLDHDGFEALGTRPANDGQLGNFGPELTFVQEVQKALPHASWRFSNTPAAARAWIIRKQR
ncbi:MAG: hypothetical protein ACJASX_003471 [Limisphaerales bacterium]|jgi:hypothetical protein